MGFIEKSAVTEEGILFSNFRTKDGQLITIERFKEDELNSMVQLSVTTLGLDRQSLAAHSIASLINNKVGKQASYETYCRLKDKAL